MLRLLACATALMTSLAGSALAAPPPPKSVELYAIECGRLTMPNADFYSDDGAYKDKPATMVVPCYLIRHPKGDMIWDTGLPQAAAPVETPRIPRFTDQLAQLGITPADIKYLSVSHSHFDHIGNAGMFASATWIVDPDEKAYAFSESARKNTANFARYSALETSKTIPIEQPSYDVFGDKSVVVYQAPGHTPGHTILLIRLKQAGPVMLTGDMWHIAESRPNRRVPRFNTDRAQTLRSMDLVEALAKETKARVILEHVPADFDSLPKFPTPLK